MKSIKPTKTIKKIEQSNIFVNIIKNINEIDLGSTKNRKKRSFSNLNIFKEDSDLKLSKLPNNITIDDTDKVKQLERNKSFNFLDNSFQRKSIMIKEINSKNKSRKNFILKSEFNQANKNEFKAKSPNLDNREKYNNTNIINFINSPEAHPYSKDKIQNTNNINYIEELNINSQDNIISNYNPNNLNNNYSIQNFNNNINFNENKSDEVKKQFQNMRNDNSINNNTYNNNYISFNFNNIYYGNPFQQYFPNNFNYNINNNFPVYMNNNIPNMNNNININTQSKENIIYLSKTLSGCQILNNKIISDPKYANEILFPNIINNLKEICINIFGNSMIQTLLGVLTFENIDIFLSSLKNQITDICLTEPGSRVMQTLIEKIKDNSFLLKKLIFYLNNDNLKYIFKSTYGHHFIKNYLSIINKKEFTNFIYIFICNNFIEIATNKYGVILVERAFGLFDGEELYKLLQLTEKNYNLLMKDCFGNYLIQYIFIQLKNKFQFNILFPLIKKMTENLIDFCKDKYSSFALEKLFEKGDEKIKEYLINYLLTFHCDDIINILINPNGFYIIKKAMYIKNEDIKSKIVKAIMKNKYKIESGSRNELVVNSFCNEFSDYI